MAVEPSGVVGWDDRTELELPTRHLELEMDSSVVGVA